MATDRECNFRTGRILGKRFPEALVHTVHRTRACGTRPMDSMDLCFRKTLSDNSTHAEIRHFKQDAALLKLVGHVLTFNEVLFSLALKTDHVHAHFTAIISASEPIPTSVSESGFITCP